MRSLLTLVSVFLVTGLTPSSKSFAGERIIKVMSYNVRGMPWPIANKHDRFKKIGKILAARKEAGTAPDIVLLQEAFVKRTKELNEKAKYPYSFQGPKRKSGIVNSGLYILSSFPLAGEAKAHYGKDNCISWDCLASKGLLRATFAIPGAPEAIEIVTTHMQSNKTDPFEVPKEKIDAVRGVQVGIYSGFLDVVHAEKKPAGIYAGDFNLRPERKFYDTLVALNGFTNSAEDCLGNPSDCWLDPSTPYEDFVTKSNDQHFFTSSAKVTIEPLRVARTFKASEIGEELSDHDAYEVDYKITW